MALPPRFPVLFRDIFRVMRILALVLAVLSCVVTVGASERDLHGAPGSVSRQEHYEHYEPLLSTSQQNLQETETPQSPTEITYVAERKDSDGTEESADQIHHDFSNRAAPAGPASVVPKAMVNNVAVRDGLRVKQTINYEFAKSITRRGVRDGSSDEDEDEDDYDNDGETVDFDDSWLDEDANGHELKKRQGGGGNRQRVVYISVTTCAQPVFVSEADKRDPPQLTFYVSTSNQNQAPGPDSPGDLTISRRLEEGYANFSVATTNNVYIGVSSDSVQVEDDGIWIYYVAASVDKFYHSYYSSSLNLFMIDSDRNAALLITKNLSTATPRDQKTKEWLEGGPPLSIFVQERNNTAITGLRRSYCGLDMQATYPGFERDLASANIETGLTTYSGSDLEQQFYIPNLMATSVYYGILARPSAVASPVPGGGGAVYAAMTFHTKSQANCAVLYNLSFCSSVAYAVPANPATFPDLSALAALYDNTTAAKYRNFNYSLQQIPCDTGATAQYSLNKTCADCALAYKQWLCAVSIPRCADWPLLDSNPNPSSSSSSPSSSAGADANDNASYPYSHHASYLQPRNAAQQPIPATPDIPLITDPRLLAALATNSSRNNATIAGAVQPGPYAEILPCVDLCYEIVRACPAALGFGCPYSGRGLESAYGVRREGINGGVACSEPGAVFGLSAAPGALRGRVWAVVVGVVGVVGFVMGDGV